MITFCERSGSFSECEKIWNFQRFHFNALSVTLAVELGLLQKQRTYLHELYYMDKAWSKEEVVTSWGRS